MMKLTIKEIIEATKGKLIKGSEEATVQGIATDSRKLKPGELFIPFIGEKLNGHVFIEDVFKLGAAGVFTSEKNKDYSIFYAGQSVIQVADTLKAFQDLARYYMKKFSIPVVGVTGSTGKTSTKDMIYAVLSQKYKVLKNEGNFNNHIGLPLTVFQLEPKHEVAIFEMGMRGLGEIDLLAELVRPDIAVITNIGLSHIEHLGSQENILKAKMEITNYFTKENRLVINGDDAYLSTLKDKNLGFHIIYIGIHGSYHYIADNVEDLGEDGSRFYLVAEGVKYPFELKVPGKHNIYNALCAIAVGLELGVPMELIQKALKAFEGSKMRLNILHTKENIKIINDAYNASPDSMISALRVLDKTVSDRKIACLGDMLEMGEFAEQGHYLVGREVAKGHIDMLIAVGFHAGHMARGAMEKGFPSEKIFICGNNHEAISILKEVLKERDAVLVKGSRGMKMEEIVEYILERS